MANIFVDRQAARPNRYKVTPDNGSAYYVTMERADEPTVLGTALNAENLNKLVAKSGDTMTGPLRIEDDLTVTGNTSLDNPLRVASGGTGANTAEAARDNLGVGKYNAPTFAGWRTETVDGTKARFDTVGGTAQLVVSENGTTTNHIYLQKVQTKLGQPLAVDSGGTGAADVVSALSNLGIGSKVLYNGSLQSGTISLSLRYLSDGYYTNLVIVGCSGDGRYMTSTVVPVAYFSDSAKALQLADSEKLLAFTLTRTSQESATLKIDKNDATGKIIRVFGVI